MRARPLTAPGIAALACAFAFAPSARAADGAAAADASSAPDVSRGEADGGASSDGGVAHAWEAGSLASNAPPAPLAPITPAYPEAAMKAGIAGNVSLILTIDRDGTVTDVEVETPLPGGLTESAVAAARAARFRPATDATGGPIKARMRWIVQFTLPERRSPIAPPDGGAPPSGPAPPTSAAAPPAPAPLPPGVERFPLGPPAQLAIHVREKGTGKDLPGATVYLEDVGEVVTTDGRARAERQLPPGAYVVVVRAAGHVQLERIERLRGGERLERSYFLEKERLNEYETIVRAAPPRPETGVVTLQAEEIHNIPGTFGDPFRTAMLLPGVGSIVSGLGYPVIRGESPGETGTFIDQVKVPLLYHFGFGPAVVHPRYLESLDFHPGNFPAEYGRFTGALIQAHTIDMPEEPKTMLSVDLAKLSAFHSRPFRVRGREAAVSAAARYGTFAFLARAIDPRAVLDYWDYQTRADLKLANGDLRLFFFGAQDTTGTSAGLDRDGNPVNEELLKLGFHRMSARYRGRWRRLAIDAGLEVGPDYTTFTGEADEKFQDGLRLVELIARPHLAASVPLGERVKLRVGTELLVQSWDAAIGADDLLGEIDTGTLFPRWGLTPGVFAQADWQPTPRWLIRPGVRLDHYSYMLSHATFRQTGIDPRLAVRYLLRPGLFLKGGVGLYQSPPRFIVPWPGLEGIGLNQGLNRSLQSTIGAEVMLPWDSTLNGLLYYNWIPRVSEYALDGAPEDQAMRGGGQSVLTGRSYGLELIARRRLGHRLFGWVTYTLARSERNFPEAGWRPANFDQTQLVNAVVSYALGRSWTISTVFHYNSGRPYTPRASFEADPLAQDRNLGRLPDFWRFDLRIDKREAFDTWYLDFYVDWLNITFQREAPSWDYRRMQPETVLLTIPTIGLQVVF